MKELLLLISIAGYWILAPVLHASAEGAPDTNSLTDHILAKPTHYFNDYASLIDSQTAQQLDQQLEDFERQTSNQILVVIYPSLPADTAIEDFALAAFRAWKPGQQGRDNGAILFVFMRDRKMRISTGYGMEATLTNDLCKRIISDEIAPRFQQGDFGGGLTAAIGTMIAATRDAYAGTGKTVAKPADRRTAQQGSPTEPGPTTIQHPAPTGVVHDDSSQDEAIIQYMMQQHKMTHDDAERAFTEQPDYWTQWAEQRIPGESILNMPSVFTRASGQGPPNQAQIITARRILAAQEAAAQAKMQASRQEAQRNQQFLKQAGITVDGVRNWIRQAIASRNGTPVGDYPMILVYLTASGRIVGGEPQWEAYFTTYDRQTILAGGHGNTVTSIIGSIIDNL
jgi:hypothetical protein